MLGPVGGFGSSWVSNAPGAATSIPSGYAGISFVKIGKQHWGWGSQLVVSSEGYKTNYIGFQQADVVHYLRLPLRAYYFLGNKSNVVRPDFYLGPSFGAKLNEHQVVDNYGEVNNSPKSGNFDLFDTGVDGGAGINVQLAKSIYLSADLGYYQGVTDAVKDNDNMYDNDRDIDISLSLSFNLGK